MTIFYIGNVRCFWLIGWIALFHIMAYGDGNGLCNNSGGYRFVLNDLEKSEDITKNFPALVEKLRMDEVLSAEELIIFMDSYKKLLFQRTKALQELSRVYEISGNALSHPTLLSRNLGMAMDYLMSEGLPAELALDLSVVLEDRLVNVDSLISAGMYTSDLRTLSDLAALNVSDLRLNGDAVPNDVKVFFREKYHFDRMSLVEMRSFMEDQFTAARVSSLEQTDSIEIAFTQVSSLNVGDSALISYNVHITTADQTYFPPRRYTCWVQRITPDHYILYTPASNMAFVNGNPVWLLRDAAGKEKLLESITDAHSVVYDHFSEELLEANLGGSRAKIQNAEVGMKSTWGNVSESDLMDVDISDFLVISHRRPALPLP